jgi:hypothetical protein
VFLGALSLNAAAQTNQRAATYLVEHPRYGVIGTYTHEKSESGEITRISSQLHVKVKLLGMKVYRQDVAQNELLDKGRLISFQSAANTNGSQINVHGRAENNRFVITSPAKTFSVSGDVLPCDPWLITRHGSGQVVSMKSGKIDNAVVTGGESAPVLIQGKMRPARHFNVRTDTLPNEWQVWIDEEGTPVKFRSVEQGTPIDFTFYSWSSKMAGDVQSDDGHTSPYMQQE